MNEDRRYRNQAHTLVAAALKMGMLIKPERCQECGSSTRLQAHHPDYKIPLEVIWLCHACHACHAKLTEQETGELSRERSRLSNNTQQVTQDRVRIFNLPVMLDRIITSEGDFYLISQWCKAIGLEDVHQQIQRLQSHTLLKKHLRKYLVLTEKSRTFAWCLSSKTIPLWLCSIATSRLSDSSKERVANIQLELLECMAVIPLESMGITRIEPQDI